MNVMVAAHPAYPFGTLVRVTNLKNRRSIQVRIVDRGPAPGPRAAGVIIDLSRHAAQALGLINDGRAAGSRRRAAVGRAAWNEREAPAQDAGRLTAKHRHNVGDDLRAWVVDHGAPINDAASVFRRKHRTDRPCSRSHSRTRPCESSSDTEGIAHVISSALTRRRTARIA